MGSFRSLTLWKSANGTRCVLVPQDLCGSYDVRLLRHEDVLEFEQVPDIDAAYRIATAWQHEQQAPTPAAVHSTQAA